MKYILTITEMAKLRNTTSETLRYYDKIGLFKPDYISESGHRYYSIRQYEKLGTILELKGMGMSLTEIQQYFDNRNYQKSVEQLKEYQKKFEENLKQQMELNTVILNKIAFLEGLAELPEMETVFEADFPERYMLTFQKNREIWKNMQCFLQSLKIISMRRYLSLQVTEWEYTLLKFCFSPVSR